MLSGAGFLSLLLSRSGGLEEGSWEQPTLLAAVQTVGSFHTHLHPLDCSATVAGPKTSIYSCMGGAEGIFWKEIRG